MQQIKVLGLASNKVYGPWPISERDKEISLMDFLRQRGIPIASSCDGEGQCMKCVDSLGIATCQIKISEFIEKNGEIAKFTYL